MANSFAIWYEAARPKTLWAGVAPVILATGMALGNGTAHLASAVCALMGAILIQVGTNYANDYFDFIKGADTAERTGPVRATQAGWVKPDRMKQAAFLAFALALLPGCYIVWRGGWPFVLIGLLAISCGLLYTAGPFPLGYIGIADLFVLFFFGPVAVCGTYYIQAYELPFCVVVVSLAPGLLSVALLSVNNLRDIEQDRKAGKKTLAVRLGAPFTRFEYLFCVLVACGIIPCYIAVETSRWSLLGAGIVSLVLAVKPAWKIFSGTSGADLNLVLASTGRLLLVFSIAFSLGWNW